MTAWLLTYLLHSTLFLALAWLAARGPLRRRPALEEAAWRFALMAALVTASVQLAAGYTPLAGRWGLGAPSVAVVSPSTPVALHLPGRIPPAARMALRSVAVSPVARPAAPVRSLPWSALLAGLWMAGAVALGARWLAAHLYLSRRLRARPEVVGGDMHRLLGRLAGEAGLGEQVRLSCSSRLPVPIALGLRRREICVPPRALASLSPEQQEGMLAHELAHLVRRDPFWLAFSHFLASVLFVQPLNFVARRRLRELSELRSDEWAVGQTGRPLSLARCLTEVAGWSFQPLGSLVAPGMADRPSHLAYRIRRLLSDTRSPENRVHPLWLAAGMAVLLVTVVAAAPKIAPAAPSPAEPAVLAPAPAGDGPVLAGPGTQSERSDRTSLVAEIAAEIAPKAAPKIAEKANTASAPELAGLDDTVDRLVEEKLSGLDAELDNLYDRDHLSAADEKELDAQISAIDAQIEQSMKPSMEEAEKRMDAMMKDFANSRTWKDLEARAKELEQKARLSDADIAKITANAEKMAADAQKMGRLTEEQKEAFRKQAQEAAKQAREMAEMGRLTAKERAEIDELSRKAREEQQRFMKDHAAEIETMRQQIREQAARMREEIKRRVESDPKLKERLDRHLSVMDKERADERKKRDEERERRRKEEKEKDHSGAVSGGARGGVKGGVAGGVTGGVAGGVEGGVAGGVSASPPARG